MTLKPYTEFINRHDGETAFICGAGLSFYDCMSHAVFNRIFDHVVVSVNSSFISMPWSEGSPDKRYWISNDALVRRWSYWESLKNAQANKIVRNSWSPYYNEIPDFYQFWPRPTAENVVKSEDKGLCYCSSVPSALDLCLQMGCKTVYLLGVDQYFDKDGNSHFWQKLPRSKQPVRLDRKLASHAEQTYAFVYNNMAFPALANLAKEWNAKVYNCSIESRVKAFDIKSFNQVMGEM